MGRYVEITFGMLLAAAFIAIGWTLGSGQPGLKLPAAAVLNFVQSIVASTAWPTVVLVAAFIFRKPLSSVINRVKHLKYKEFEADFEKQLEKVRIPSTRASRRFTSRRDFEPNFGELRAVHHDLPLQSFCRRAIGPRFQWFCRAGDR